MSDTENMIDILKNTLASQKLAVLSTQKDGFPYANLIAFASTDDCKFIVFVTDRNTRKYDNMKNSNEVAVLLDSRRGDSYDFNSIVAITALGKVTEAMEREKDQLKSFYVDKHPHLLQFIESPTSAIMIVDVERYIVASFNMVWSIPTNDIT